MTHESEARRLDDAVTTAYNQYKDAQRVARLTPSADNLRALCVADRAVDAAIDARRAYFTEQLEG